MTFAPQYLRKDSCTNRTLILRALDIPRSAKEIATVTGITCVTARSHLKQMLAARQVHITRWVKVSRFVWERIFAAGPGRDAVKPSRLTQEERNRRAAERRRLDPELAIRREKSAELYLLTHRAPRPDPAAAWITGGPQ